MEMDSHSILTLYKASAGSGKTFMLAVRYISFLVKNPQEYRNILAVTFTNKATAEMKQRIMSQLYGISHSLDDSAKYFEKVRELVPARISDDEIRRNADKALAMILQDYGNFRVETIDSFLQSVLRGIARELQLGTNLELELDLDIVIREAVDSFLANLDSSSAGRTSGDFARVLEFVEDNIDNAKAWGISNSLIKFSKQLYNETFMENRHLLENVFTDSGFIGRYRKTIREMRSKKGAELLDRMKSDGEQIIALLNQRGIAESAVNKNSRLLIENSANGTYMSKEIGKTISKNIDDPATFFLSAAKKSDPSLELFAQECIVPLLAAILECKKKNDYLEHSCNAVFENLNELALLMAIRREINRLNGESGRFILADTANLLSSLTEGDTSFVFEKTGSFIRHLMVDEFQDTSRLQWKNLGLLMHECLSQNQDCLVVGDVKQSIYRWRNGDWNILNSEIEQQFTNYFPQTIPLKENRRSLQGIINFNNNFFPLAKATVNGYFHDEFGEDYSPLPKAYHDVEQLIPSAAANGTASEPGGTVRVSMFNHSKESDYNDNATLHLIEQELDNLTASGVRQGDIALLLRDNGDIRKITSYFALHRPEYRMISGEAFQLDSSFAIRIIVNALRWITDESDKVALTSMIYEWKTRICGESVAIHSLMSGDIAAQLPDGLYKSHDQLQNMPMYELVEFLSMTFGIDRIREQDSFMMAFLDLTRDFSVRRSSDISDFISDWDEKFYKKSVPSVNSDSITLMTIHKAKGLEFHSVIIPYCDWEFYKSKNPPQIWAMPQEEPYNGIPFQPVKYNANLSRSTFSETYREETGRMYVDNLNLLYVALTRPKCNMSIIGSYSTGGSDNKVKKIGDVLYACMNSSPFVSGTKTEDGVLSYSAGNIMPSVTETKSTSKNPLEAIPDVEKCAMDSYAIRARFKQSGDSRKFARSADGDDGSEQKQNSYIEEGKLLHGILSSIRTSDDIVREVRRMLSQGVISGKGKADEIIRLLSHSISNPAVSRWFDGHWTLFNETSVLFRSNGLVQTRRPDRVMTDGNETIVVDFKFGRENEDYMHQVQEYMELLSKMGFRDVKGYIWYVYQNKTINC